MNKRGVCIPEDNSQVPCMLVSELCENGDLFDYIVGLDLLSTKRLGSQVIAERGLPLPQTSVRPDVGYRSWSRISAYQTTLYNPS